MTRERFSSVDPGPVRWKPYRIIVLAVGLALTLVGPRAVAQVTPTPGRPPQQVPGLPPGMTPQQALELLRQRPELGRLLRQRIQASGMSADEIRAALRAAGYPGNLLDAYLSADTTGIPPAPGQSIVEAVSRLGIARFSLSDSMLLAGDTIALRLHMDSLRLDSIAREDSLETARKGLTLFGLDVFRRATTAFQSVVSGPVDDEYVLGPGDVLVLLLTGAVEDAQTLEVTRGGFVVIPRVGQIYVNNLTLGQLRDVLYERLSRVYSGVSRSPNAKTKFVITVANVRMLTVRVAGEVGRPGSYQVPATGSALTALYAAAGLRERANFRAIEVRRGSELVGNVDLYDYLLRGIVPTDIRLASGDVVFVPIQGARVKVTGEVKRPAIYEIKSGETLRDLLHIAGGLQPTAATGAITIDRIVPPAERTDLSRAHTVISVSLDRDSTVQLAAGDSIAVYPFRTARRNAVTIHGAVGVPGTYQLEEGMRLSDLIALAGGTRQDTYTGRAQIVRTSPDSTRRMIGVAVPSSGDPGPDNPVLEERDVVTIFSKPNFRAERYVAVWGAVRQPGYLPYADSMTLRDAILLAGGLREEASLDSAQVSRFRGGIGSDSLQTVFLTPMDASFRIGADAYPPQTPGTDQAPTVILQPYDQVLVRSRPGWEAPGNVVITGEVRFPGRYAITSKDERLSALLQQAGGLTPTAYANGIRFFRLGAPPPTSSVLLKPDSMRPVTSPPWSTQAAPPEQPGPENSKWSIPSRIGVDLPLVLRDPGYRDNLILQPGDSIHIPRFIPVVRVEGAVNAPGTTVPYRAGAGKNYYVDGAGGYAQIAYKRGTYVLQGNGLVDKSGTPEPGSVIVVPAKTPGQGGTSFLQVLTSVVPSIISAVTTIVIVLATR